MACLYEMDLDETLVAQELATSSVRGGQRSVSGQLLLRCYAMISCGSVAGSGISATHLEGLLTGTVVEGI